MSSHFAASGLSWIHHFQVAVAVVAIHFEVVLMTLIVLAENFWSHPGGDNYWKGGQPTHRKLAGALKLMA